VQFDHEGGVIQRPRRDQQGLQTWRNTESIGTDAMKLLMLLLLMTLAGLVQAQFTFTTNNGSITITGYTGSGGSVVIPATINGIPVTSIGGIGLRGAFANCPTLTSVTLPTNLVSIGIHAFFSCPNLTNVLIADGITNIGAYAFTLCTSLTTITVDTNNPAFSSVAGVLFNRNQTTLVQYPGGLLGSYMIPSTVTSIGDEAFQNTFLTNIIIPDSVTNIGNNAFGADTNLVTVTLPKSIVGIGTGDFLYCTSLKAIIVDTNDPAYSSLGGVMFDKGQTMLIQYPEAGSGSYIIPGSVTNIGYLAFAECSGLSGVTIPNSVTTFEFGAFTGCTSLTNIVIPNQVTSLGDNTFSDCTSLTNITLGNSVTTIGVSTFASCTSLLVISIPASVVSIGQQAFIDCNSLNSVTIPASVTNIAANAFAGCTSLTEAYFQGDAPEVDPIAFSGDETVSIYYLPSATGWSFPFAGLPGIEWIQFTYVTNNGSITITGYTGPGGAVTIPASIEGLPVTSIGSGAFAGSFLHHNTNLTSITIPGSVSTIQYEAFYACSVLTNAVISYGVSIIGPYAFNQCTSLSRLVIPDSVTNIGNFAFVACLGLVGSLRIPDSVIAIGGGAFNGCAGLSSVTIGANVASIGGDAFITGGGLSNIYFKGNAPGPYADIFGDDVATVYYLPGTSGWSQTFDGLPTELWNPQIQTGDGGFGVQSNEFGFNITGTSNLTVLVAACTNLSNPVWSPVSTNTLNTSSGTNGISHFRDPQSTNYPQRFYRLSSP
jgi:hypothetical protein